MSSRKDILGLRALALLFVVSPLIGLKQVSGWFIGFDIFFVIVGYLITKHLFNQYRKNAKANNREGYIELRHFYLPAFGPILVSAIVVIGLSYLLASLLIDRDSIQAFNDESIWAALMSSNVYSMTHSIDYFFPRAVLSPFAFSWATSLLIQGAIIFSSIIIGALSITTSYLGAKKVQSRQRLKIALLVTLFLSFFYMLLESRVHPNSTPFSSGARIWEFALGGLCATVKFKSRNLESPMLEINRVIALILICISPFVVSDGNYYYIIGLPLLATGYLLWATPRVDSTWSTRILSQAPLPYLGIIAFPLLLWVCPIIYFQNSLNLGDGILVRVLLVFTLIVLAIATHALLIKDLGLKLANLGLQKTRIPSKSVSRSSRMSLIATVICIGLSTFSTPAIFSSELNPGERPVSVTAKPTPTPTRPANVVFLGASITSGYGVTPSKNWPALVSSQLGWKATNLARYGTGFTHGYSKGLCRTKECKSIAAMAKLAISLRPDAVVISGGRNDCVQARTNPYATRDAIRQTLTSLRNGLPDAEIISMAVVLNDRRPTPQCYLDINSWIAQASSINSISYIPDVSYWLTGKSKLMTSDGIHPTTLGHAEISRRFVNWFRDQRIQIRIIYP